MLMNIRFFAGSSFFCLGTTPYAMAAQPFMVTIHQYPHFLLVVSPPKKILQFRGKWPFFSICFRFWSRQIASPNSRCLRPSPCVDGHTSQDFVAAFNPGCLCYTVTLLYTHFTRSSLLPNMKNCQQHPHVRWLHGQSLIVLLLVMIIFIDFHLQDYMHFIMTSY